MLKTNEITLDIGSVTLPSGATPLATDWIISKTEQMRDEDIVDQSLQDTKNIFAKVFILDLEPDKTYYHMARLAYKYVIDGEEYTGFVTSEKTPFIAKDGLEEEKFLDTPSIITIPKLETSYDKNYHPAVSFAVTLTSYVAIGNSRHIATTYWIENSKGEIVYFDIRNENELTRKVIDIELIPDDVYTLRAIMIGSNGDVSQPGSLSFRVRDNNSLDLLGLSYFIADDTDLDLKIKTNLDYTHFQIELYKEDELVTEQDVGHTDFSIDKTLMEKGKRYMLTVTILKGNKKLGRTYKPFYVLLNDIEYLPGRLPYPLGGKRA